MNGNGIFLRDAGKLPPSARKQLEKIGNEKITSIKLVRTPLDSTTKLFLNIITLGQFDKITKKYHDDLFHLTMWINGKYNLEKNEVIKFGTKNPIKNNSQTEDINVNKDIDFNTLLEKTRKYMGDNKFTSYNAETNNCQDFILSILNANGLGTKQDKEFVKQDTKEVFNEFPTFSKIIGNIATTAGAIVDKLIEGEGRPRRLYVTDDGRYFYLQNKKRKFVKTPIGMNQQQIVKINLGNMVKPKKRRRKKRKTAPEKKVSISEGTSSGLNPPFKPLPLITDKSKENEQLRLTDELIKSVKVITDLQVKDRKQTELGIPQVKPLIKNVVETDKPLSQLPTQPTPPSSRIGTLTGEEVKIPVKSETPFKTTRSTEGKTRASGNNAKLLFEQYRDFITNIDYDNLDVEYANFIKWFNTPETQNQTVGNVKNSKRDPPSKTVFTDYFRNEYIQFIGGGVDQEEEKEEVFVIKNVPYSPMLLSLGGNVIGMEMNNPTTKGDVSRPPVKSVVTEVKPVVKGTGNIPDGFHMMPDGTIMADIEHEGKGYDSDDGLYNTELENIADNLDIQVPVIASDEIPTIILPMIDSNTKQFGFIINTDDSNGPGKHWTSIFIDNDDERPSIEFFDPLGDAINPELIDDIKMIVDKLQNEKYFLFKENMVQVQSNDSSNCGIFAMKFLEDRYNDVPFIDATHYRNCMKQDGFGEKDIKKTIKRYSNYL
jgi:hypothetical protein